MLRFLELRRAGRTPAPADFNTDFPALITRTVADLPPDERHILRSVSLFDAFDLELATRAAGLTHQAAAARLTERPFIRHDPLALWPYNLHALIHSTLRTADDATDDRWTDADWRAASTRALAALGNQWRAAAGPDRRLLVGCLRQGLAIARDHRLDLDWLTDAAHAYTNDYVWEPLPLPEATAAHALAELLAALARRQHEHRSRTTVERLTGVLDTGLLPAELAEMARYFLAKAHRDLGNTAASRTGMQEIAAAGGRYAPDAARGLSHLARAADDFPTAQTLGWPGRGHRVLGDIAFAHGDMATAATAYTTVRTQAEQHGNKGEQAIAQAHLALSTAFTEPTRAEGDIAYAEQLLAGLDQRATTLTAQVAELVRMAGRVDGEFTDRTNRLRTEIAAGGLTAVALLLNLAVVFHHAVRDDETEVRKALRRLAELTAGGDYVYYLDIAHHMAGLALSAPTSVQWAGDADAGPARWRALVTARR